MSSKTFETSLAMDSCQNSKKKYPLVNGLNLIYDEAGLMKYCLLLSKVTNGEKVPREFQLEAALALLTGQDSLIHAATGSGKTLCMVLPALLDPTGVSLVISPLKRLQVLQVSCINYAIVCF
jgi:superfamily II DNA helicase RecQ